DAIGLITDFGNAAIDDNGLTEVAMPVSPPENVGGDTQERFVRPSRRRYKIQEVVNRGQVMLIQVVKEERGNKGAALTTFLSLAGRYCVLMPNTDHGGGVSRKITNHQDRRRLKEILDQLEIPEGMAAILRTAGMEQEPPEIQRDLDYLLKLWDSIREQTLQSTAPSMIYEEANLIKRSVRDLYRSDISEILIAGKDGYERARDFMQAIMPEEAEKIKSYDDPVPLFIRYQVEKQIDALDSPIAQLRSGGYLVINPTEALVSIDVNSGRATRERHIEETALKTNLEACNELARQLRLRDLAGLVVIDFIDMEDSRNNAAVERRLKEVMKNDRARLQIGRISPFGLMELSRQRMRPSLTELNCERCPHCSGTGVVRSADSAALSALRAVEEEALRQRAGQIMLYVPAAVAIFILNNKRGVISRLEKNYGARIIIETDETIPQPGYKVERVKGVAVANKNTGPAVDVEQIFTIDSNDEDSNNSNDNENENDEDDTNRRRRRRNDKTRKPRNNRRKEKEQPQNENEGDNNTEMSAPENAEPPQQDDSSDQDSARRSSRRRGRRGGRRRNNDNRRNDPQNNSWEDQGNVAAAAPNFPIDVRDIDTTPRPVSESRAATKSSYDSSYETVNPPADKPKAGWWKRLRGE
ncbi:MAG: ribonuclease E/G, partial [Bdellovibrionales bacterium]